MRRTPEEIDRERRRFSGAVAFALAAAQLGLIPSASAKSGMSDEPGVRPETRFPGFSAESLNTSGTTIHVLRKGTGRPLLLLHGYPESVEKACLMDIAPTLTMYEGTNQEFATRYMWWFFLIQAYPLPEHMIGLDPEFYLQKIFGGLNKTSGAISADEMKEYVRVFSNPATIHSTCEDFRAGADIALEMDKADEAAGKRIECPLHVLWGGRGRI